MTDDRSPQLIWTPEGAPRSGRFGDVYFSREDGLAEARAVFLAGAGLPEVWRGRKDFTVAELGFGTGLNIVALLDLWRREGPPDGRLHVFTVEGYPLTRDEAAQALAAWPAAADAARALLAVWPAGVPGFHRMALPEDRVTIDLAVGEADWALAQWSGQADAWFLDGFAPAANPAMWSDAVMDGVRARSAPGARIATFTVAGAVRRALSERGFDVVKRPGHGRKRERLEAHLPGETSPPPAGTVAVIGAGIAGAALARALTALGRQVVVVEGKAPGSGGSGFPAGLVTPRLDAGDAGIAALYAQALERAGQLYEAVDGAVIARGVVQMPGAARDVVRFGKIAAQPIWPQGDMTMIDGEAAQLRFGEPAEGGLDLAGAMTVAPGAALKAWLADTPLIPRTVTAVSPASGGWRLTDAAGETIVEAAQVVVAGGWGSAGMAPDLGLRPVRGQAEWVEGVDPPAAAAWGGYAAPTGGGLLFGASHDREEVDTGVRSASTAENLQKLKARFPALAARIEGAPLHSRAAVRATTPDRLPIVGEIAPGLFVLTGLGSRGLCLAPLLGEHLAAVMTGTPGPLPRDLAARIDPERLTQPTAKRNAKG